MIGGVVAWLVDPAHWSGPDGIGHRLLQHLGYSAVTVILAAALAIPAGLWIGHTGHGRWLVTAANGLRAVPTLGLLFALTMWFGPHLGMGDAAFLVPSIAVLVLLAIPPVLSGAYAGVDAVDPSARDAAYGVGMRGPQVLRQVEVPLALPLLISGVRSAALQVVATATVAAYVGLGGLGRFLIDGLASNDYEQTAAGAVIVTVVALLVDLLGGFVAASAVSAGITGKFPDPNPVDLVAAADEVVTR